MKYLFFTVLSVVCLGLGSVSADGSKRNEDQLESKFHGMVNEVRGALEGATPDFNAIEKIIKMYCNMTRVCTYVAAAHVREQTKSMDVEAKKKFLSDFLEGFEPVYTSYLARVLGSDTNAKTFKEYELLEVKNLNGTRIEMKFQNKSSKELTYIMLDLDKNELITSIQFGSKNNLVNPISADRGSFESSVNRGKEPKDIFAKKS